MSIAPSPSDADVVLSAAPPGLAVMTRRAFYKSAYLVLQCWWLIRRPHTHGVKLVLRRGDDVLFVRHSYGKRGVWEIPGGGRKRDETADAAALREGREELGLARDDWRQFGHLTARAHATAHLTCFDAEYHGEPLEVDLGELVEARWAPSADPPQPLGEHAAAILQMRRHAAR